VRLSAADFLTAGPKNSSLLQVVAGSGNQGAQIILDFVTDNKYYFTGNNSFLAQAPAKPLDAAPGVRRNS
jgi:hypothetical protein